MLLLEASSETGLFRHLCDYVFRIRNYENTKPMRAFFDTSSLRKKLCSKKSRLLTCQIYGLLVNTFSTDEKYPAFNRNNLTIPIKMQLSQKQINFSEFFAAVLKSGLTFKDFE